MRWVLVLLLLTAAPALAGGAEERCAAPGDWEGRIGACTEVIARRTAPRALARAYLHRGEARLALGALLEAVRDLREAARLAPDMAAPHLTLGAAYLALGRADAAEAALAAAVERAPGAAEARYWSAVVSDRLGRPEAALADLDRALELDAAHPEARLARARLRCGLGDVEGAVADTEAALAAGILGRERLAGHLDAAGYPAAPAGRSLDEALQDWARAGCP